MSNNNETSESGAWIVIFLCLAAVITCFTLYRAATKKAETPKKKSAITQPLLKTSA